MDLIKQLPNGEAIMSVLLLNRLIERGAVEKAGFKFPATRDNLFCNDVTLGKERPRWVWQFNEKLCNRVKVWIDYSHEGSKRVEEIENKTKKEKEQAEQKQAEFVANFTRDFVTKKVSENPELGESLDELVQQGTELAKKIYNATR